MRGEITICCRNEGKNSIRCNRIDCRCSVVVRHTRLFRADSPIARCVIAGRNIHFVRAAGIIVRKSSARDEQKKNKKETFGRIASFDVRSLHNTFRHLPRICEHMLFNGGDVWRSSGDVWWWWWGGVTHRTKLPSKFRTKQTYAI